MIVIFHFGASGYRPAGRLADNIPMLAFALGPGAERRTRLGLLLTIGLILLPVAGKAILVDTLDPDCFWHLRVAEQLRGEGIGPLVDRLSFASTQMPWTPYSWLAELGMRWLWTRAGWRGAVAMQAMLQSGFIILIALACRARTASQELTADDHLRGPDVACPGALQTTVGTAFGALLALPYLSFRPVTAALVLLAACNWLIVRDRQRGERTVIIWAVLPITMLMVNIHLYALLVPLWFAALLAGAIWERGRTRNPAERAENDRRVERYALLLVLSGFSCLATPMLPGVIGAAVHYQFADPMVAGPFIREMQPFFHGAAGPVAAGAVLVFIGCVWINRRRLRAGEIFWMALSCLLLLRMGRFAAVFAIAASPVLSAALPEMSDRLLGRPALCAVMSACLVAGVWRVFKSFPSRHQPLAVWLNRNGPQTAGYPCAAADYVAHHVQPNSHRLINEFDWGGYLEWRLGERFQTFVDGRTQVFTSDFWRATYLGEDSERLRFLSEVEADAAVLPLHNSKFRETLAELGWKSVYHDDRAEVLLPPAASPAKQSDWPTASIFLGE